MPNITSREELWQKGSELLSEFCEKYMYTSGVISGPVMYRFNTALAMQTSMDSETVKSIYKLAPFVKDRAHDDVFMQQYMLLTQSKEVTPNEEKKQEEITTAAVGKRSIGADVCDKSKISEIFQKWRKRMIEMGILKE